LSAIDNSEAIRPMPALYGRIVSSDLINEVHFSAIEGPSSARAEISPSSSGRQELSLRPLT
jgi:hypothetical protein